MQSSRPGVGAAGAPHRRGTRDRLLTPAARAQVALLLAQDLDKFGRPSGRTTLEAVSVWADEVDGTGAAHPRWHSDNAPLCGTVVMAQVCRGGECGNEQLKRLIRVLGDARAPLRERNEALEWVVHLTADLHPPLPAADNGDRGGNLLPVALAGVRTRGRKNLHRAWDNDLVRLALHAGRGQRVPGDIGALARDAQILLGEAGQGSPDSWVTDTNNLARNVAYRYPGFTCGRPAPDTVVLDAGYVRLGAALARERWLL